MSDRDINGDVFDPAIHQEEDGKPIVNKNGTFRKKAGRPFKKPEDKNTRFTDNAMVTSHLVKAAMQYRDDEGKKVNAIRKICEQVVDLAVKGDKWAIEFYVDRTEGKATQKVETSGHVTHQLTEIPVAFTPALDITDRAELLDGADTVS